MSGQAGSSEAPQAEVMKGGQGGKGENKGSKGSSQGGSTEAATSESTLSSDVVVIADVATVVCGICHDSAEHVIFTECMHGFCRDCLIQAIVVHGGRNPKCPLCNRLVLGLDV
jgi:hypothetical protein